MSRIWLSYSSKDNFEAIAVRDWLNEIGWDDVFLDPGFEGGGHPGERQESAVREKAESCEAALLLVSRNWLATEGRGRDYVLAERLNKRIFVAFIEKLPADDLPFGLKEKAETTSLAPGENNRLFCVSKPGGEEEREIAFSNEGLDRLNALLKQAGLAARFFAWPPENEPNRAPYRGLLPLEDADAGVFFGRDELMIRAADELRGLAMEAAPRIFVILGASGAGKSSFLRAGLWPRLARHGRHFLPIPVIRAECAAGSRVCGLAAALFCAAEKNGLETSRARVQDAIAGGAETLRLFLKELAGRAASGATPPTLLIAIDEAEELFRAEAFVEGERLLTLLRNVALAGDPAIILVFAIRSESYDLLARAAPLEGLRQRLFPLPPMRRDDYRAAIEGPAERVVKAGGELEIEPALIRALLEDVEKSGTDALPLLALTLDQLYRARGGSTRMTHADYVSFGGLAGSIEAALRRALAAADSNSRIPGEISARLALLQRALVPLLACVDPETKTARRRILPAARIAEDARPLIDLIVEQGLLTRRIDADSGDALFELAHEALLRRWSRLSAWLAEDVRRVATLESVKRASLVWDANARDQKWAAHGGAQLEEAEFLYARPDLATLLDATDRAYLAACIKKEKAVREMEEGQRAAALQLERKANERLARRARTSGQAALVSSIGLAVALAFAILQDSQWRSAMKEETQAKAQRDHAEKSLALATQAASALTLDLAQQARKASGASAPGMTEILSRALKLQEQLIASGANSNELRRSQSVALNQIAEARLAVGDAKGALAAAQRSTALMEALSSSNPRDAGWRRDLSVSYEKLGDAQKALGDLAGALKSYQYDLAIAEALSASDPGNARLRWDLSVSYEKVGDVQKARGDLVGALKSYRMDLAIREALSNSDPGNAAWRRDLAVATERVGAALAEQVDVNGAIAAFERALAIYQTLVRAHPDDVQPLLYSIAPHWRLAELDKARAREHLEAAVAILEPLAAADRLDANQRGWIADIRAQLAALDQASAPPKPSLAAPAQR